MKKVARLRNPEEISANTERMGVRTTGRIKKAKVVFDPSDNYVPRNQRSSAGSVNGNQQNSDNPSDYSNERRIKEEKPRADSFDPLDGNYCYICRRKESKKGKSKLIACKDCHHKVHIICLQHDFEDTNRLRENYRCDSCQVCSSCYEGREDGELITCTKCAKSFHFACHIPSMARFPTQSKWFCSKCTIPKSKSLLKVVENAMPTLKDQSKDKIQEDLQKIKDCSTTSSEQKVVNDIPSANGSNLLRLTPNDLCEIPNVKSWSADEVKEFFTKFFPEEAYIFKDQDIDGQSLLLMKRSDVVNKLAIRLGPALRIYNLILKIQSQSTDPTLGW